MADGACGCPVALLLSDYKSFSGKINKYALRAQAMPRHYALKVLEETHQHWRSLHLEKKRDIIGESTAQAGMRVMQEAVPAAAASSSPSGSATASTSVTGAAAAASPRLVGAGAATGVPTSGHMQQAAVSTSPTAPAASPTQKGQVQPIGQLTGMEQVSTADRHWLVHGAS